MDVRKTKSKTLGDDLQPFMAWLRYQLNIYGLDVTLPAIPICATIYVLG